ncbi:hypothetical protein CaCOL14_009131 [Colletotrichum acutatum]
MPSQESRSSEDISDTISQEPMQCHEKRNDDDANQDRPETARNVSEKDKDNTEASSAESSAQNPPSSSEEWLIKRFWGKQVSVVVEFETCRDHLGTSCAQPTDCLFALYAQFRIESFSRLSSEIPFRMFFKALLFRPGFTGRWWDVTVPDVSAPDDQLRSSLYGLVTPDASPLCS